MAGTVEQRFWRFVEKGDGCWLWLGNVHQHRPYGKFSVSGRTVLAHRFSYEMHRGAIPRGMLVCHCCDEPRCVNPEHLFVGTQADNIADRDRKGRRAPRHVLPRKLSDADAAALVAMGHAGATGAFLARAFGVSQGTVSQVRHGTSRAMATEGMR